MKLEKGAENLQKEKHMFEHFVQVADTWLQQNGSQLIRLLETIDSQGEGVVSYDELKSGRCMHVYLASTRCELSV